mgnify:FL=1|jgi:hypothetical protein
MKELPEFEEQVPPLICTYGHQTVQGHEFTNEYSVSTPATSTTLTLYTVPNYPT